MPTYNEYIENNDIRRLKKAASSIVTSDVPCIEVLKFPQIFRYITEDDKWDTTQLIEVLRYTSSLHNSINLVKYLYEEHLVTQKLRAVYMTATKYDNITMMKYICRNNQQSDLRHELIDISLNILKYIVEVENYDIKHIPFRVISYEITCYILQHLNVYVQNSHRFHWVNGCIYDLEI